MTDRERMAAMFRRFGEIETTANDSPLYRVLCEAIADSPDLLELAAETQPGQPPPNLLLAAVHYLLEGERQDPLAAYYASMGGELAPEPRAGELFGSFCRRHRDEIVEILHARIVQTNEVRRSALLLPAFAHVFADTFRPLALIEIGPSAGLNLLFDRYRYDYGPGEQAGPAESPLLLRSESRGDPVPLLVPLVASRVGIDLNPLDVRNAGDVGWLRALIWPEHNDRRALLEAATGIAQEHPPRLLKGDLFELLPGLVQEAHSGAVVCLFATMVLNQFTPEMRQRLRGILLELSHTRELYMVVMGFSEFAGLTTPANGDVQVVLIRARGGQGAVRLVARANPHGRWIDYRGDEPWTPWTFSGG